MINSTITRNKAKGGPARARGLTGNPLGGGVYNGGNVTIDALTLISGNTPDNRYGY